MGRGTYDRVRRVLRRLGRRRQSGRQRYTDAGIFEVYFWAVLHDRPVSWACDARSWPPGARRGPLPSESAVSRRMRTGHMAAFIGRVLAWRVAPMHTDERAMARRMLGKLTHTGSLLADANDDSNRLFDLADQRGAQLVAPRRYGPGRGLGRRPQSPARLRSKNLLETDTTGLGRDLMRQRWSVERFFGTLTSRPGGLGYLPAWVRSWRRVRNWVAAKLLLDAAHRCIKREEMMQ